MGHDEDTDWCPPEQVKCWSCHHLTEAQEQFSKAAGGTDSAGLLKASTRWSIRQYHPEHDTAE